MIVRDFHQSGFHGVTQDQWAAMNTAAAQVATVGAVTESIGFQTVEGWAFVGRETKVVFRADAWVLEEHGVKSLETPPWHRGNTLRTDVPLTWALLSDVDAGLTLLRSAGHLPAHLFKKAQKAANQAALDQLGDVVKELVSEFTPDVTTLSFDFNRSLGSADQRRLIREAVHGTHLRLVVPPKATRGFRKIDGLLTTGDLPTPSMLPRARGFDHRGVSLRVAACPS